MGAGHLPMALRTFVQSNWYQDGDNGKCEQVC